MTGKFEEQVKETVENKKEEKASQKKETPPLTVIPAPMTLVLPPPAPAPAAGTPVEDFGVGTPPPGAFWLSTWSEGKVSDASE